MRIATLLLMAWLGTTSAIAADFNCQKVKLVVPFAAGGSADVAARVVADRLGPILGTTFYIENKGGAAGNTGSQYVAESVPDGCTLLINGTVIATFADSYPALRYDPFKDLTPVGGVGTTPSIVLVHPSLPASDIKSLVELSKSRPNGVTFANAGYGLQQHLATEEIGQRSGAHFVVVPYKGGRPAMADMLAGRVDFGTFLGATTKVYVEQGQLKALAVLQDKRSKILPDVPSSAEQGFPGLLGGVHFLLFAPAKTPKDTVAKISVALHKVVSEPALQEFFLKAGLEATPMTPDEVSEVLISTRKAYQPIIKKLDIKLN